MYVTKTMNLEVDGGDLVELGRCLYELGCTTWMIQEFRASRKFDSKWKDSGTYERALRKQSHLLGKLMKLNLTRTILEDSGVNEPNDCFPEKMVV